MASKLKEIEIQTKALITLNKQLRSELEGNEDVKERLLEVQKEINDEYEKTAMKENIILEAQKERVKEFEKELKNLEKIEKSVEKKIKLSQQLTKEELEFVDIGREKALLLKDEIEKSKKLLPIQEKIAKKATTIFKGMKGIENSAEGLLNKIGLSSRAYEKSGFSKFFNAPGTFGARAGTFVKTLAKAFHPANLLAQAFESIAAGTVLMFKAQDDALYAFNKTTLAVQNLNKEISELGMNNLQIGIDIGEASEAMTALFSEFNDFSKLNRKTQSEIAELTAIMNEFSISPSITAQNFNFMTKGLGLTIKESDKAQREIITLSRQLGQVPAQMLEGFKQLAPELAKFGKQAIEVFKELQIRAKATGAEVSDFIAITKQFRRLDTASQAVANLSNHFGAFLDVQQLIRADTPEKIWDLVTKSLDRAGVSFDNLNSYQKELLAQDLGIEVDKLRRLSGALTEQEKIQKKQAETREQLAEISKKLQPVQQQLMKLFLTFAVPLTEYIDDIKSALSWTIEFVKGIMNNGLAKAILVGAMAFVGIIGILTTFAVVVKTAAFAIGILQLVLSPVLLIAVLLGAAIAGIVYYLSKIRGGKSINITETTRKISEATGNLVSNRAQASVAPSPSIAPQTDGSNRPIQGNVYISGRKFQDFIMKTVDGKVATV